MEMVPSYISFDVYEVAKKRIFEGIETAAVKQNLTQSHQREYCPGTEVPSPRTSPLPMVACVHRRLLRGLLCILWTLLSLPSAPRHLWADVLHASEAAVKAAFLYNFAKFVEWPDELRVAHDRVLFCALGDDQGFMATLENTLGTKTLEQKPVQIRHLADTDTPADCSVLFVETSERPRLPEILGQVAGHIMLTVGDNADMARSGLMIGFIMQHNNVRFVINTAAAEKARVVISSQLLKLAVEVVNDAPRP